MLGWMLFIIVFSLLVVSAVYLYRFSVIILEQERIYEGAIKALDELENKFSEFESMPVYFDNPSSREMFLEFKNNILLSRNKFLELIDRLLLFSKKKYIIIEETQENET
jgi:hypothetical protein